MDSSAEKLSLFLLITFLSSSLHTHARDSQFFNKIPTTTNNQQPPNFLPENENTYDVYGHESGQNPPSTTTTSENKQPDHQYLPKNYNPVSYVTQPTFTQESFTTNSGNNNGGENYYNQKQEGEEEQEADFKSYPTATNNNYYYGRSDATLSSSESYSSNNGGSNSFRPQGMSDTRLVEKGKYFYDVNSEKYSSNHPYEFDNRNLYRNNANEFNAMGGYQNQEEFKDEDNMP